MIVIGCITNLGAEEQSARPLAECNNSMTLLNCGGIVVQPKKLVLITIPLALAIFLLISGCRPGERVNEMDSKLDD